MPTPILMPALSPTMTEGNLARWVKKEGEEVRSGDVIAEIETDKATMEVEAVDEGRLGRILVPEGTEGVKVNAPIALLLAEGEDDAALEGAAGGGGDGPSGGDAPGPVGGAGDAPRGRGELASAVPPASPEKGLAASDSPDDDPRTTGRPSPAQGGPGRPEAAPPGTPAPAPARAGNGHDAAATAAPAEGGPAGRTFASPLARRMAAQAGLDLGTLKGTGPHGRIVKADIEAALAAPKAAAEPASPAPAAPVPAMAPAPPPRAEAPAPAAPGPAAPPAAPHEELALSSMRKVIARRLTEAKQTIPHFYLSLDVELDALLALRTQLNAREGADYKLSVNDFVVKAVAVALRRVPGCNAAWGGDRIFLFKDVDVAVAVAIEGGLITPIVRGADAKGLAAISNEMKDLAARAKAGKLKPEEFQGGGFSVSNLGMFGIREFAAVINPPQACILAVGAGERRPVVRGDAIAAATVMTCTLSVDHRAVDGALGAQFLAAFKKLVEDPMGLLL